jgi:DNA invertase Pin-like site-specific DNA recombinase
MSHHSTQPIAFSYIRFSHDEQAAGDSLRRQTAAAEEWCRENGVALDTSTTFRDLGRSAFTGKHRANPDRNALAAFLRLVEQGKVPRGSYLIIENLDRLSREHIRPALGLLLDLIEAGISVVQLKPVEQVFDDGVEPMHLMMAIMELSRGHSESAIKSERVGKAWREKKRRGRENGETITSRLPAWVQECNGKRQLIPERAAVVRRIFELAVAGYGGALIVRKFTEEKVPAFGECKVNKGRKRSQFSGKWNRAYIGAILKDRRALGEFQPCRRDGTPDGPPIKDYFPPVVSEGDWLAARAGAEQRRRKPGRTAQHINVFAGLLKDARNGGSYYCATRGPRKGAYHRVLLNTAAAEGREALYSFPFLTFEAAVLSMLREIDPRDVLKGTNGHDDVMALEGDLGQVEAAIASIAAELDAHGESPVLYGRLRTKESRKAELTEQLTAARQRAANPLSAAWGEQHSLLSVLESAPDPDDTRLRLRAAIRRTIDTIYMLVVPRGRVRLCAVQINFAGSESRRCYVILHRGGTGGAVKARPSQWWARSLASVVKPGDFDLRDPELAADLEKTLFAADLGDRRHGQRGGADS